MSKGPKLTNFVSEMDQFLNEFDKEHPRLSKSQEKEVKKYKRIYHLRDNFDNKPKEQDTIWQDF